MRYPELEVIAAQLVGILAPRRHLAFSRTIEVDDDAGGDVEVSVSKVTLHPIYFTTGNPLNVVEHILDLTVEFDRRREIATKRAIADLKGQLRYYLRELRRLDPASLQPIIEEELGLGEKEILHIERLELP